MLKVVCIDRSSWKLLPFSLGCAGNGELMVNVCEEKLDHYCSVQQPYHHNLHKIKIGYFSNNCRQQIVLICCTLHTLEVGSFA